MDTGGFVRLISPRVPAWLRPRGEGGFLAGQDFLECPTGGVIFGLVGGPEVREAGITAGEIRLQSGYPGPKGFGCLHVEGYADRIKTICGLGFRDFPHFCAEVGTRYGRVGRAERNRIALIMAHDGYECWLIVEWKTTAEQQFWTIVTGVVSRTARCDIICEVVRTDGREPPPNVAKRTRFETLSLPKKITLASNGS